MNNDLGFPRIVMGVYEETSSLFLNNTGQRSIEVFASPEGGVILTHDRDGKFRASLPSDFLKEEEDDEDEDEEEDEGEEDEDEEGEDEEDEDEEGEDEEGEDEEGEDKF